MFGVPADPDALADLPLLLRPHPVGRLLEGDQPATATSFRVSWLPTPR